MYQDTLDHFANVAQKKAGLLKESPMGFIVGALMAGAYVGLGIILIFSVAGMAVSPGEIVHMDENGACKFPADRLQAVLENAKALQAEESERLGRLRGAADAAEVRAIFGGHSYGKNKE